MSKSPNLPSPLDDARELTHGLVAATDAHVQAVLLYGSHLLKASPDRHSAYDFVVVVDDYGDFYRALKASGEIHRPAWLFSAVSRVLPPNVIAFTPDDGQGAMAKCLVVSLRHFRRALGPRPPDHFLLGRMVQKVALVWARDDQTAQGIEGALAQARAGVMEWVGPYLDETFDAAAVGRRLLEVCYRGEFRPEAQNRSETIFEAQRHHFVEHLAPVLEERANDGGLVRVSDEAVPAGEAIYRFAQAPSRRQRTRWNRHFMRSKARVTARWVKHVLTFDNWLPYITRKVERRMGAKIELTPLERRFPVIFLWPRVIRTLRARPRRETPS